MPRILGATRSTSPHEIGEPQIRGELERGNAAGLEHYRRAGEMLPEAKSKLEMPRGVGGLRVIFISVDGVRSAICSSLKNPEKEAQIARALGLQLIDIGYKVLVTKSIRQRRVERSDDAPQPSPMPVVATCDSGRREPSSRTIAGQTSRRIEGVAVGVRREKGTLPQGTRVSADLSRVNLISVREWLDALATHVRNEGQRPK